ncbi:glycosyltransferase family 39 protein [Leptolyngbya sp. AN02str]|uniref:glycosyltransferase family 39 protein n=1 Tax=Leptolyngbya sp. AN02str TaxID=3423363 RepID=UPI003D31B4EB
MLHDKPSHPPTEAISPLHYGLLAGLLLLGVALRFWHLDLKPLWMDEVITAIFGMGRSYAEVPVQQFFGFSELSQLFTVQPGQSCGAIAQRVSVDSVHPPLFFCLLYAWMSWLQPLTSNWVWLLRAFPALCGVGAIAALYALNRIAFSPRAGLVAAGLMAVSPFAVYLSQEARHYTLPMLLISLGLVGLVLLQQDLQTRQFRAWAWMGWIGVNVLGLYVHYFFLLALVAQIAALVGWLGWSRDRFRLGWLMLGLAIATIFLAYLPWLRLMLSHVSRPETDWLSLSPGLGARLAPIVQGLAGWIITIILLPVEEQPLAIAIPLGLVMIAFAGWVAWLAIRGLRRLWYATHNPALPLLLGFTATLLLEFLAIIYLLGKDLTLAPRYNFVYYPGMCALLGAALTWVPHRKTRAIAPILLPKKLRFPLTKHNLSFAERVQFTVILLGLLSSIFVVNGYGFYKSFNPDRVAANLLQNASAPISLAISTRSPQEIALGLSFGLGLQRAKPSHPVQVAFIPRTNADYQTVWATLATLLQSQPRPLNLWVVGNPDLRQATYPSTLTLQNATCTADPNRYYRTLSVPYQGYPCINRN